MNQAPVSLDNVVVASGSHTRPEDGACLMEWVAIFAGEPFSDHPACTCPVIGAFARRLNDRIPDDAARTRILAPLIPLLAGTRSTREVEIRRAYLCADFAVRGMAPLALDAAELPEWAARLRALPPVVDRDTAGAAQTIAHAAYAAHAAAASAAYAAHAAAASAAAAAAAAADAADAAAASERAWDAGVALIRRMCEVQAAPLPVDSTSALLDRPRSPSR